jgi:glycerol-3-phosphate dehydrogenase
MREFSLRTRRSDLERAAECVSDVLVVGGGITGAGVAREAALAGWNVVLLEKGDFASGTSSRSSKLVHGGVRYLAQGDVGLVKEAARERAVLRRIAPHLVRPVRMLIPVGSRRAKLKMAAGLWTFDRLAGEGDASHVVLDRDAVLTAEAGLLRDGVAGGVAYTEYVTDDARLTLETIKSAAAAGARVANYAEVIAVRDGSGDLRVAVHDRLSSERLEIRTRCLVNAAGPWFDAVRGLTVEKSAPRLQLTRGIHLAFRRARLPMEHAVVLRAPDGRSTFVVPRGEHVYVGTTDTMYEGAPEEPGVTREDTRYLLDCLRASFTDPPSAQDIVGTWSGVRPLVRQEGKEPSEISRRDEVQVGPGPVVAVAGGKLTTYRRMAERVVERVGGVLGKRPASTSSGHRPLVGGDLGQQRAARAGVRSLADERLEERWWMTYGSAAVDVIQQARGSAHMLEAVGHPQLRRAELEFAVDSEMVATLDDVLRRRSSLGLFEISAALDAAPTVARVLGDRLGWSENQVNEQVSRFVGQRAADLEITRSAEARGAA